MTAGALLRLKNHIDFGATVRLTLILRRFTLDLLDNDHLKYSSESIVQYPRTRPRVRHII
jgi:hypothetical protein